MNAKKVLLILLVVFLGFWMFQDPHGFAVSAKAAGGGGGTPSPRCSRRDPLLQRAELRAVPMRLSRPPSDPDIGRHLLRDEGEVIVDEVHHHWAATPCRSSRRLAVLLLVVTSVVPAQVSTVPFVLALLLFAHAAWGTRASTWTASWSPTCGSSGCRASSPSSWRRCR